MRHGWSVALIVAGYFPPAGPWFMQRLNQNGGELGSS
jgi:hypothetical protein